ncbi:glycine zipper 2TM domain-containing protein [Ramlibacter rhizophilus]|uniref:Glycine zipper 2TM domain-containing protein n=1 Tax=Ramlibacter rhizophilus TaxID=1781167 RepID=A0A4Z0BF59_9BURK|nr:glycine zipper 2TM domain-containing protein [Ramlibacter rhizophilus]TFY96754.1 glycine zipper 2TM domain-containing protein [Ramlibacter rhizophilus]
MPDTTRFVRTAQVGALALTAAALAACSSTPLTSSYPTTTYPTATYPTAPTYPAAGTPTAGLVFGRVTNIEYVPPGAAPAASQPNILGAVVGGVAGAVLGRQIGGGSGRDAATVLGGLGGAAVGSQVGGASSNPPGATMNSPSYRVTVVTDQGTTRMYEVAATGDLRVGDRVRVDNGVIYRV